MVVASPILCQCAKGPRCPLNPLLEALGETNKSVSSLLWETSSISVLQELFSVIELRQRQIRFGLTTSVSQEVPLCSSLLESCGQRRIFPTGLVSEVLVGLPCDVLVGFSSWDQEMDLMMGGPRCILTLYHRHQISYQQRVNIAGKM